MWEWGIIARSRHRSWIRGTGGCPNRKKTQWALGCWAVELGHCVGPWDNCAERLLKKMDGLGRGLRKLHFCLLKKRAGYSILK